MDLTNATTELLRRDFAIGDAAGGTLSEAEVIQLLADEIDRLMHRRMEWLLSKLYTMDVAERDVHDALHPSSPVPSNLALARLVFDRQRRRVETKARYKPEPLEDEDMAW